MSLRAICVVVVATSAACGGAPAKPGPAAPAASAPPPAATTAPAGDACTAGIAKLQPQLDADLALRARWGEPPEVPATVALPVAADALEPATPRVPVVTLTAKGSSMLGASASSTAIRHRLGELGAHEVVLAIDGATSWRDVTSFLHELPEGLTVDLAYAVPDAQVGDATAVAALRAGGAAAFRTLGAGLTQRCPAVGDLTSSRDDPAGHFARGAGAALQSCHCAVSPDELLTVYGALFSYRYLGLRRISLTRGAPHIGGGRLATFAEVAPKFIALVPNAAIWVDVDH